MLRGRPFPRTECELGALLLFILKRKMSEGEVTQEAGGPEALGLPHRALCRSTYTHVHAHSHAYAHTHRPI